MPAMRYALRANASPTMVPKSISLSLGNTGESSVCDGAVDGNVEGEPVVGEVGVLEGENASNGGVGTSVDENGAIGDGVDPVDGDGPDELPRPVGENVCDGVVT